MDHSGGRQLDRRILVVGSAHVRWQACSHVQIRPVDMNAVVAQPRE